SAALDLVVAVLIWQAFAVSGNPDPLHAPAGSAAGLLDIGVLVFREGLECILVLAAITAGMSRTRDGQTKPVTVGVCLGFVATLGTWFVAISVVDNLGMHVSALQLQAWTGLLAI